MMLRLKRILGFYLIPSFARGMGKNGTTTIPLETIG
jgi:hypothetical protein